MDCLAQKDSTVLKYQVKANKGAYRFYPDDAYFFAGCRNRIKITNIKGVKNFEVTLSNGTLTRRDSFFYINSPIGGKSLLSIYEIGAGGKKKLVRNKEYEVIPYPNIELNGVKCDSAMGKLMMMGGRMYARYKKTNEVIPVSSFKMDLMENNKFVSDSSANDRLTQKMRDYVNSLPGGSLVYIKDIRYRKPDGSMESVAVLRLFVFEDDRPLKYGF